MNKTKKTLNKMPLFLLRISMGWMMFYAGLTKVLDSSWSAIGYLEKAQTFNWFYVWLTQPDILPLINFINQWALLLLGASLILGVFVKWSSYLGSILMLLYYFPVLSFPYVGSYSFLVDEHIIYIFAMMVLATAKAGKIWGLDAWLSKKLFHIS